MGKSTAQNKTVQEIHLQPGAKSDGIVGLREGILHVRVTAPPRKGQANQALLALIARELGVSKSDLAIIRGYTSRNKSLEIRGLSSEELKEKLVRLLAG